MAHTSPNIQLRAWRQNAGLSRGEMAKMLNLTASGIKYHLACDEERVRRWEAGEVSWPREPYRLALRELTHRDPEDLGFVPTKRARATDGLALSVAHTVTSGRDDYLMQADTPAAVPRTVDFSREEDRDEMRRREFVGLTGAALFGAILNQPEQSHNNGQDIENLAVALVEYSTPIDGPIDLTLIAAMIAQAKRNYQACRYSRVVTELPPLLRTLRAACTVLDGDAKLQAHMLSSEAHHVAASILFKRENKGLAWLAADRSLQAAHTSQSPLMIGSSSRVLTRALMYEKHHRVATSTASSAAARMNADLEQPSGDELSIYGSLLLSGAVAAAHTGNRHTAAELLDEADQAARRLGYDGNHQWTAFGPANVLCHRVNVALKLGDAGTAIDYARQVDLGKLPINERKATLLLDTARAFLMCGKHDRALYVLRAAGEIAIEEVTSRPAALRLVRDIAVTAPTSIRREAREYAASLGVVA
ncbi:helix-turn-helix domain-containing protein [Streptosporangium sp. NPDC000396]|uniref:helix-turn-helix domain-containing protein n=1 Tax=Streptosporangium sp. NPDC000396 TaxID=3366185 RepID=UPI0036BE947C